MKDKKYFILTIISILILSLVVYRQFKSFQETSSQIEFPKFEMPKFEPPSTSEGTESRMFVSSDGELKFSYSSGWVELPKESLEKLNQEMVKANSEIIFFAQKFNLEKASFASLIVQGLILKEEGGLESVIENIKKEAQDKNKELEIIKLEIKDKQAYLETRQKREEGTIFRTAEKIILIGEKVYLIDFVALDQDWMKFEKEVREIFDSIQIIN